MIANSPLHALRNQEYRHLLSGRFFLVVAFRMLATLLGWWIYKLTDDPFAIGLIGLSEVIPAVSSALYAGHIIDTHEKKRLLLIFQYAYLLLIALLLLPAFWGKSMGYSAMEISYFIYGIIFLSGICKAFLGPLIPAMIPTMVPHEDLPKAIPLHQSATLIGSVTGHALGGLLIAWIGIANTLLSIVGFLFIGSLFFWTLNKHFPLYTHEKPKIWNSVREGISFIYKTKEVLGAMALDMFGVLFGGAVAMIPVFATDILHVGAEGFGLLNAATDIGAMCSILFLSTVQLTRNQGKILLAAVAGFGLCIIGFALSKWYWLSFGFLLLSGVLDGINVVIRGTIIQLKTPDKMQGRVLSVSSIFVASSNELGQFESGVAAKLLGVVRSVIFGGCMTVLVAASIAASSPKLRKMEYR